VRACRATVIAAAAVFAFGCAQIQKPETETFVSATNPPAKQEFRWSNGKAPKSLDPARAAAAPETDIVRALYEGLTELDPATLQPLPGVAESWSASEDNKVWTFKIRKDAKWSNGHRVTAEDFVASWRRIAELGPAAAHPELFANIVGFKASTQPEKKGETKPDSGIIPEGDKAALPLPTPTPDPSVAFRAQVKIEVTRPDDGKLPADQPKVTVAEKYGVEAVSPNTLKITLVAGDKDLPKLVASPTYRPIFGDGKNFDSDPLDADAVTNGAFAISSVDKTGVVLERSETYWDAAKVNLETVKFVPSESAEAALDAYKRGEVDALTNADLEPLAVKLLTPFEDFKQETHGALNFYEINPAKAPLSDRRVREALAASLDREKMVDADLDGSTSPASRFLPTGDAPEKPVSLDVVNAQSLLEKAGYPNGENFPQLRLVVNRNDTQIRIAKTASRMWKQNLNIDVVVEPKDKADYDKARTMGDYDLIRRGVVLPTTDALASLMAIFDDASAASKGKKPEPSPTPMPILTLPGKGGPFGDDTIVPDIPLPPPPPNTLTEAKALYEMTAIPLYFPRSFMLVKPYVRGFGTNTLDAPLLSQVSIDPDWQPTDK